MTRYLARRFILLFPTLLGISLATFALLRLIPGDPAVVMLGEHATPEQAARLREAQGLDQPLPVQYLCYVSRLLRGDWGYSIKTNIPVLAELGQRLPATIELSLAAMLIACALGVPLGVLAARHRDSPLDWLATGGTLIGLSLPLLLLGLLLSYLFGYKLGWLPPSGRLTIGVSAPTSFYVLHSLLTANLPVLVDALRHLILPALTLSSVPLAVIVRITRACVLEILAEDYIRTAQAKGLRGRTILFRHALRNAWPPILTTVGLQLGSLLSGAILTETIFSWPGMGWYVVDRVLARDYPAVQGTVLVTLLLLVLINLAADICCAYLDPRIRYG